MPEVLAISLLKLKKTYTVCPSITFALSMEKMNTTDIKDEYGGMPPQIVTALKKKKELRNKIINRMPEGKQVNTEQIINIGRFGEHQIIFTTQKK